MKKLNATLSLVALVLASLTFSRTTLAQQPPDNVQGNWTIYSTNIEDGQTVIKHVQIAQYGNRITGYFEGPIQSGPIQGEVNVHHIRFSTVTRNVLNFHGQIYGDNMSGEYGLHGKHAQWQAVRTTGIGAAPQAMTTYGQSMLIPPAPNHLPWPSAIRSRPPIPSRATTRSHPPIRSLPAPMRRRRTRMTCRPRYPRRHPCRRSSSMRSLRRSRCIPTRWSRRCSRLPQYRTRLRQRTNGSARTQI